jgi:hypothetical protein
MSLLNSPANDLAVMTCYFNPNRYATKRRNFDRFSEKMSSQGQLWVIECAFGDAPFELPPSVQTKRVKTQTVLWQKERLLNILIQSLPSHITKIAWVDCDLIFENSLWVERTRELLDVVAVVQPFETVVRLPEGSAFDDGTGGSRYNGFSAVFNQRRIFTEGRNFLRHGHTGFAWAARRSALPLGLYDGCISGNGDHFMSHAFIGDWETVCFRSHFEDNAPYWAHFRKWSEATYPSIRAKVGFVPGNVLHLWHGADDDRRYLERNRDLNAFAFDPEADLRIDSGGCFEWNSYKPELHAWAKRYFGTRLEDGKLTETRTIEDYIDRIERAIDRSQSQDMTEHLQRSIAEIRKAGSTVTAREITQSLFAGVPVQVVEAK